MTGSVLFQRVQVRGAEVDVEVRDAQVHRVTAHRAGRHRDATTGRPGAGFDRVVDGGGGALVPGLHDHHLHVAALAARFRSLPVGPPDVRDERGLARTLEASHTALPPGEWIRAVGYHESVAGDLDRVALDRLIGDRPVRVQHRSGIRWTLNSAALAEVGLGDAGAAARAGVDLPDGVERDDRGRPTGRLDRLDDWLRERVGPSVFPDLGEVGRHLAESGVTGVTDCTPYRSMDGPLAIARAVSNGELPQRVLLTGHVDLLDAELPDQVESGPVKIVIDEHSLPNLDDLITTIVRVHRRGRRVAMHLVTEAATAFALAAWNEAGAWRGDRIEHGSQLGPATVEEIARLGLVVATQPGFVAERGDEYLAEVEPDLIDGLYRCATLLDRGVCVIASTDAPYTRADPWQAIRAAVERTTPSGRLLGDAERIGPERAVDLFTADPHRPWAQRVVTPGSPADLCLLHLPLDAALANPSAANVRASYRRGSLIGGDDN